jgi:pimeloyl-ACP methyl ester carboxylesterase
MKRAIQIIVAVMVLLPVFGGNVREVKAQEGITGGGTTVYLPLITNGNIRSIPAPIIPGGDPAAWPKSNLQDVIVNGTSGQHALFYTPITSVAVPLIVSLHTWSTNYTWDYPQNAQVANWAIANGWIFIHPNFRGPNNCPDPLCDPLDERGNPNGMGSDFVVQDIVDAVNYAKSVSNVDTSRIYLFGQSGGGHAALLMAGRRPDIWAGVSVWAPITDLDRWRKESLNLITGEDWPIADRYGNQIANSCRNETLLSCENYRSPITYLSAAANVPLDINAGLHDGHTGSVPFRHSLLGWNKVLGFNDINPTDITTMNITEAILPGLIYTGSETYSWQGIALPIKLRRVWNQSRVTIFDGTHADVDYWAGLTWLNYKYK